jgi:hypothetical protein
MNSEATNKTLHEDFLLELTSPHMPWWQLKLSAALLLVPRVAMHPSGCLPDCLPADPDLCYGLKMALVLMQAHSLMRDRQMTFLSSQRRHVPC